MQNLGIASSSVTLTYDPVTWLMCMTQGLMMKIAFKKTQFILFENISMCKEVMAWTSLDARTYTKHKTAISTIMWS
jgi:hypothetical protein